MRLIKVQREALRTMARAGGVARAKVLSPERRRQIARQAACAVTNDSQHPRLLSAIDGPAKFDIEMLAN
jgi:hypothetical protein